MAWTALSFPFASLLTSTKMTQLYDNFTAMANGDSGAPSVQTAAYASASIDQVAIGASAVGQAELKTASGIVSTTNATGADLTLAGGAFGFYPRLRETGDGVDARMAFESSIGTNYITNILLSTFTSGTAYAQQTYVQASPPYNLGNGDIPIFIFLVVDGTGNIESTYIAEDPPWANNGPTDIRPDKVIGGKKYKMELILPGRLDKLTAPSELALYQAALANPQYRDVEITQAVKQTDMPLIPHPFQGNDLTGKTIVLIDPVGFSDTLHRMHLAGEDVADIIHSGNIILDNRLLTANTPPGVVASRAKFKLTP